MHLFYPMPHGKTPIASDSEGPIVFFDGVCGLCNGFVDFVLARDRRGMFRFAALQGETAATRLGSDLPALHPAGPDNPATDPLPSMILWDRDGIHRRSEAALRTLQGLGGVWSLARVFRLVPRTLRDGVYDFVAKNRYRWFGKRDICRIPAASEKERFLP